MTIAYVHDLHEQFEVLVDKKECDSLVLHVNVVQRIDNGVVELSSKPDKGSTITIRLPLTLAILDGQLVRVGSNTYIFPLVSIVESLQCKKDYISKVAGGCYALRLREEYVPIVALYQAFDVKSDSTDMHDSLLVVVDNNGSKVGIIFDELLAQQQVVIKSLERNYHRVTGVSGATILGDGTVALILDVSGIVKLLGTDVAHSLSYTNQMARKLHSSDTVLPH